MNFTNTLNISPPSFLSRKTPSRVVCPKTVRNAYQTLAPWGRTSPVTNTGPQEAKASQLYNVQYIIPSFAVRASSNTKWGPIFFWGVRQFFSHGRRPHTWGAHSGSRFGEQCLQNTWAALSDWPLWSLYLNAFWEIFGLCFCRESSAWRSACISSRSWPMPCVSTKPSQHFPSAATRLAMRESRPGGRSGREFGPSRALKSNGIISVAPYNLQMMMKLPNNSTGILNRSGHHILAITWTSQTRNCIIINCNKAHRQAFYS